MGTQLRTVAGLTALAALALCNPAAGAAAAGSTFVRADQAGYASAAPKRAYLMAHRDETGAPFSVARSSDGVPVYSGVVGSSTGSWSKRFGHVYALDFDAVQEAGEYTIAVGGHAPASSPSFPIAPASALYEKPLPNALAVYADESDGAPLLACAP